MSITTRMARNDAAVLLVSCAASGACLASPERGAPPIPNTPPPPAPTRTNQYNPAAGIETLSGKSRIIIGVHGFTSDPTYWWRDGTNSWNDPTDEPPNPGLRTTLYDALGGDHSTWDIWGLDWRQGADGPSGVPPTNNEINAQLQGQYLARALVAEGHPYEAVHLLGHSLGGRVIETAATILSQIFPKTAVHTTFLDAYTPYMWDRVYGSTSTYSEHYFTRADSLAFFTEERFPHALNVDVGSQNVPRPDDWNFIPEDDDQDNVLDLLSWQHNNPHFWYKRSVRDPNAAVFGGFGHALSLESGRSPWPPTEDKFRRGQSVILNADGSRTWSNLAPVMELATHAVTPALSESNITGRSPQGWTITDNTATLITATPFTMAYLNFGMTTTRDLNFIEFNYRWLDASGDARLSVWVDDHLLWATESLVAIDTPLSTGKIIWTGRHPVFGIDTPDERPLAAGFHEIRFRLDLFSDLSAGAISFWNLRGGYIPAPATALLAVGTMAARRRRAA